MKKLISLFLVLFISAFCALPSFAAKSVKFSASDGEVFAGDEFTVDIFISDYSLLKSATLLVEYDKKAMQFLDLNVGPIVTAGSKAVSFKDVKNSDKSYIQIDYKDSSASLSTAGKFLSLTFVANDTAVGETAVKVTASGNKITTASGAVTPDFKNGKIKIINNAPVTESKSEPSSEESSSSAPISSENAENPSNSVQSPSQSVSQNANNSSASGKNEEKSKKGVAVAAVAVAVVVICVLLFGSNGNEKRKPTKKRKRKKRKSRR